MRAVKTRANGMLHRIKDASSASEHIPAMQYMMTELQAVVYRMAEIMKAKGEKEENTYDQPNARRG